MTSLLWCPECRGSGKDPCDESGRCNCARCGGAGGYSTGIHDDPPLPDPRCRRSWLELDGGHFRYTNCPHCGQIHP